MSADPLEVTCPFSRCRALPGTPCIVERDWPTPDGTPYTRNWPRKPHAARVKAAERAAKAKTKKEGERG